MSIGIAIFASVVLLLVVFHKTFRKVFFWAAGVAVVGGAMYFGVSYLYERHQDHVAERERAAYAAQQRAEEAAQQTNACKVWEFNHPAGSPVDWVGPKENGEVLYPPVWCEGPLENAYQTTVTDTLVKANQAKGAAKQAKDVTKRAAILKAKKEAAAEAQRIYTANVDSTFWKVLYRLPDGVDETLRCRAYPTIELGEVLFVNGRWESNIKQGLSTFEDAIGDHVNENLAVEDVLHHAHYELCTR